MAILNSVMKIMIYQNAIDIIIYLSQSKKDTIIGTDFMYMILWVIG